MVLFRSFPQLITFLFATVLCSSASVANYYIAQTPAGTGNGTGCANANSAAFFNKAGNWGTANAIGPGTTVHICGNVTTALNFHGSGTSGNPITLLFEASASMSTSVWTSAISMSNLSYLIVDGGTPCGVTGSCNGYIANTNNSTVGIHSASQGIIANSCNNCEIRNLGIYNLYVHSGSNAEVDQTQVNCIEFSGSNVSIHDNTFHDAGWCLINWTNAGDSNVRIYSNNIYNIDHGLVWGGNGSTTTTGQTAGPVYFYNNHVHGYSVWDTSSNSYHHDGIHCYSTGSGALAAGVHWTDMWIYNNKFDGDTGDSLTGHIFLEPGVQTDGSQTPCMDATSKIHIFGNTFLLIAGRDDPNGILDIGTHSASSPLQSLDYFNNTIIAATTNAAGAGLRVENGANSVSANVKNNIFGGINAFYWIPDNAGIDHNGYVACTSYNCFNGSTNSLSTWQSQCGCDGHSVAALSSGGGVSISDGSLEANSIMLGKGINLTSATTNWPSEQRNALATDLSGIARGDTWSIGAYSGVSGPMPSPPTNLTAMPR